MLSDGDVLLLGQKARSFCSVLAGAILSDNAFALSSDSVTDPPHTLI